MKIYYIYLFIDKEKYNDSFIKTLISNLRNYQYIKSKSQYCGLYGWTTKEKYLLQFFFHRKMDLFYVKKDTIEKEELTSIRRNIGQFELRKETIDDVELILSKEELINITHEEYPEVFYMYFTEKLFAVDYTVFNLKFQDVVEFIGYSSAYDIYIGGEYNLEDEDEIEARREVSDYNVGFNLTISGYYDLFLLEIHPLALFILYYKFLLKDKFIYHMLEGGENKK